MERQLEFPVDCGDGSCLCLAERDEPSRWRPRVELQPIQLVLVSRCRCRALLLLLLLKKAVCSAALGRQADQRKHQIVTLRVRMLGRGILGFKLRVDGGLVLVKAANCWGSAIEGHRDAQLLV